jgi:hypothetical protein
LTVGGAASLAGAASENADGGADRPDWVEPLAALLVSDGQDRRPPTTPERAERIALRYAAFLRWLEQPHADHSCLVCLKSHDWPGGFFFHTGQPTILVAPQGHGKTMAATYLTELALGHRREWDVYTNVPFPWFEDLRGTVPAPPRLFSVHSGIELAEGIANSVLQDRVPAAVLDESGQWLSSHDWRSDAAESWTKFTYVERHFRTRGPVLVYHTWKTVLEPFRDEGDLRGSYCRVVKRAGKYRIGRVEDRSRWWTVEYSALPYLSLGLRGFDMNLDWEALGKQLGGSVHSCARQVLAFTAEARDQAAAEAALEVQEARMEHAASVANVQRAVSEQNRAWVRRREEIIRRFEVDPSFTSRQAVREYGASSSYVARLRRLAWERKNADGQGEAYAVRQAPP